VENLVGTVERVGPEVTVAEFSAALADSLRAQNLPDFRVLTAAELTRVRDRRATLIAQWHALPVGETLRLEFPLGG